MEAIWGDYASRVIAFLPSHAFLYWSHFASLQCLSLKNEDYVTISCVQANDAYHDSDYFAWKKYAANSNCLLGARKVSGIYM